MKKVLLILMLLPLFLFAETSQNKKSNEEFSEIFFSLEVGEIYPFFELADVLDNAVYVQGDLTYQYWKQLLGYLQFGCSVICFTVFWLSALLRLEATLLRQLRNSV